MHGELLLLVYKIKNRGVQIKKEILFTWQGNIFYINLIDKKNLSLKNVKKIEHNEFLKFYTFKNLAKEMYKISHNNIYATSESLLKDFCKNSLTLNQENCFSAFFIYLYNGNLCAFLNIRVSFEIAEIDYIYVHELYKRQGISVDLIHLFESVCKKFSSNLIHKVLIEVGAQNHPALSLYKKLNFQEISLRKKYYKNGEDAVIMEKIL